MALTTFTSGQVLTAAQMNALQANDYNQTVSTKTASYTLVAADKGTRVVMNSASATTITVNTSLFSAGDTLFLQNIGAGVCTVTAGTATVSSAGSLAIPQNGSGTLYFTSAGVSLYYPSAVTATPGGLTLVSATTIGTTVASVTVSSAFSATYNAYKIIVTGGVGSISAVLALSFPSNTTDYYYGAIGATWAGSSANANGNNVSNFARFGYMTANTLYGTCELFNPFATKNTLFLGAFIAPVTGGDGQYTTGYLNNSNSISSFTITPASGTMTGGEVRVYGYTNS